MFSISRILKKCPREHSYCAIKQISRDPRVILVPELDREVLKNWENKTMSSKIHPGKVPREVIEFDKKMLHTIEIVLGDVIYKNLYSDAKQFCQYLEARRAPVTKMEYAELRRIYSLEILDKMKINPDKIPESKSSKIEAVFSNRVNTLLKQRIYNWEPIDYTAYIGKQYIVNRMTAEFSALNRIFHEIALRNPDFKPTSLFDFGSGVGTVTWAVNKMWPDSLEEVYNVDTSSEMNDLAELLLKGGDKNAMLPITKVHYRQFLPALSLLKYNLVVCSYSLFDLPSVELRLKTLTNLWNKTADFLVIVERGNSAGFKLIHEARDFLLDAEASNESSPNIHIFSPCPHEVGCPVAKLSDKPCRFKASYVLPVIRRKRWVQNELYSFIVFRKGKKPENEEEWPRVLKNATKRKARARCRICCPDGKLRFLTMTKGKHGTTNVQLLRNCKSCDRLPMFLREVDISDDADLEAVEISSVEELYDSDDDEDNDA